MTPRPSRRAGSAVVLVLLAFAAALVLWRRADAVPVDAPKRPSSAAVAVTTAVAKQGDIAVHLDAIGTVTPVYTSTITSQVSGMIAAVHYREAQDVRKGDPLIDIDPRPYQAQLAQAEGILERDTHILEQARMDLQRYRDALARDAIAKQQVDDQDKVVLQDEGTVKNDRATVDYSRTQLAFCHITAPFAGRVGLRLVDPGNVVQAGTPTALVVVTQEQPITVIFSIAEDQLAQAQGEQRRRPGLPVEAFDRAQTTRLATGVLLAVDNQIDTTTGTVRLRAQFDNTRHELFPNQFVNVRLLVTTVRGAVLIPTSAIQHNGTDAFVYVVSGDSAHNRRITPGEADGGQTAVEGLRPGEVVANSSFERLQDNAKVTVAAR
jgi:multidrug efflux system membrane fusion protein